MVRKLSFVRCFYTDFVSASHGASSKRGAGTRCFLPKQSSTSKQSVYWIKKHNLWPNGRPTTRVLDTVHGEDFSRDRNRVGFAVTEKQPQEEARDVLSESTKWPAMASWPMMSMTQIKFQTFNFNLLRHAMVLSKMLFCSGWWYAAACSSGRRPVCVLGVSFHL